MYNAIQASEPADTHPGRGVGLAGDDSPGTSGRRISDEALFVVGRAEPLASLWRGSSVSGDLDPLVFRRGFLAVGLGNRPGSAALCRPI